MWKCHGKFWCVFGIYIEKAYTHTFQTISVICCYRKIWLTNGLSSFNVQIITTTKSICFNLFGCIFFFFIENKVLFAKSYFVGAPIYWSINKYFKIYITLLLVHFSNSKWSRFGWQNHIVILYDQNHSTRGKLQYGCISFWSLCSRLPQTKKLKATYIIISQLCLSGVWA